MDSSTDRKPGHEDIEHETEGKPVAPSQPDTQDMDETQISLEDDDDDLDTDEDVTEKEAGRADGA